MARHDKIARRAKRQAKRTNRNPRNTVWGIWDTHKGGWMGDSTGPKLFRDEPSPENGVMMDGYMSARIAAEMVGMRVGEITRYRAKEYNQPAIRKVEDVATRMNSLDALKRLEQGRLT